MRKPGKNLQSVWYSCPAERDMVFQPLAAAFRTLSRSHPAATTTFFDTFDWRLYCKGSLLWTESRSGSREQILNWMKPDGQRVRHPIQLLSGFARHLPLSKFSELAGMTEPRRLLDVVRLKRNGWSISILDRRQKTVARLFLEQYTQLSPEARDLPTPQPLNVLRAEPVKGYDQAFARLARILVQLPGAGVIDPVSLLREFAGPDRVPGCYSSPIQVQLEPEMTADLAARTIYEHLLERILLNEEGTRLELDPEFLHDFRVAVRRTRAGLAQIDGLFDPSHLKRFKKDFKWLGTITGPKRDLDVHCLRTDSDAAQLPELLRSDFQNLRGLLEARATEAQQALTEALESDRYRRILNDWGALLKTPTAWTGPNAERPVIDLACDGIRAAFEKVLRRGERLHPDSPAADFHSLRIDCKKLRYLLEFFKSLFDKGEVGAIIGSLKSLQDNLGALNDFEVQSSTLQELGHELYEKRLGGEKSIMAAGVLIDRAVRGRVQELDQFEQQFRTFSSARNRKLFARLFGPLEYGRNLS